MRQDHIANLQCRRAGAHCKFAMPLQIRMAGAHCTFAMPLQISSGFAMALDIRKVIRKSVRN